MQVISAEIFNQQITPGNSQIYKIYRDRLLIQGPVFSLDQKKLALQYCQAYQKKNPNSLCLLVQEQYYFQSWKEDSLIQDDTSLNWMSFRENTYEIAPSDSSSFAEPNKPPNINNQVTYPQNILIDPAVKKPKPIPYQQNESHHQT